MAIQDPTRCNCIKQDNYMAGPHHKAYCHLHLWIAAEIIRREPPNYPPDTRVPLPPEQQTPFTDEERSMLLNGTFKLNKDGWAIGIGTDGNYFFRVAENPE